MPDPGMPDNHPRRLRFVAERLPAEIGQVLPTRFGNLFRAFEVYPRVIYGLDAIPAWPRLQAVVPEHARKMLADAKAQLDFCVNLSLGGWLVVPLYIGLAAAERQMPALATLCIPVLGLLIGRGGYWLATSAATNFGGYVKSVFDLYRGEFAKQLGLELPRSIVAEREMWRAV